MTLEKEIDWEELAEEECNKCEKEIIHKTQSKIIEKLNKKMKGFADITKDLDVRIWLEPQVKMEISIRQDERNKIIERIDKINYADIIEKVMFNKDWEGKQKLEKISLFEKAVELTKEELKSLLGEKE